jgi:hypothetical protein
MFKELINDILIYFRELTEKIYFDEFMKNRPIEKDKKGDPVVKT